MQIIDMKINEIKPYAKNPRNNNNAIDAVANSIKEFGFKVPLVISKDNIIICGHTRYEAAKKLGLATVPCVKADALTEDQEKAFRIADNKIQECSEWDVKLLGEELLDLVCEYNMTEFGFEDNEIKLLTCDEEIQSQQDITTSQSQEQHKTTQKVIIVYNTMQIDKIKKLVHETGELQDKYDINEIINRGKKNDNS